MPAGWSELWTYMKLVTRVIIIKQKQSNANWIEQKW